MCQTSRREVSVEKEVLSARPELHSNEQHSLAVTFSIKH